VFSVCVFVSVLSLPCFTFLLNLSGFVYIFWEKCHYDTRHILRRWDIYKSWFVPICLAELLKPPSSPLFLSFFLPPFLPPFHIIHRSFPLFIYSRGVSRRFSLLFLRSFSRVFGLLFLLFSPTSFSASYR